MMDSISAVKRRAVPEEAEIIDESQVVGSAGRKKPAVQGQHLAEKSATLSVRRNWSTDEDSFATGAQILEQFDEL